MYNNECNNDEFRFVISEFIIILYSFFMNKSTFFSQKNRTLIGFLILIACFSISCTTTKTAVSAKSSNSIPCTYMRGGTSKGPFFDMRDLPTNVAQRNAILLKVMGSPDPHQIDGLGAVETVTSKVVMAQPSKRKGIDVDYLFAQIDVEDPIVDTVPPCGNMMAGVGPFAIEKGWVKATIPTTKVMVYNINTKSIIEEIVQTPNGKVEYNGSMKIDGVPGTAAPVMMNLFDQVGGKTGKLLPTGKVKEQIDGIDCSILDAGSVMMLVKASDFGLEGTEKDDYFEKHPDLMFKLEGMRLEAGRRAGMGDVSKSVLPKIGILSKARTEGNNITSRYLTPTTLHPSHAVTGAICIGTSLKMKGSVTSEVGVTNGKDTEMIVIEHPSGVIEVNIVLETLDGKLNVKKAGTVRTVRKIMEGVVFY
jgi:2-methylaconitate cis-trans-isomerase PrpF